MKILNLKAVKETGAGCLPCTPKSRKTNLCDYKTKVEKHFTFLLHNQFTNAIQCGGCTVYVQEIVAVTITISKSIYGNNCVIHKSCKKIAFCYFAKIVLGNGVAVLLQIYYTHTKRL